MKVADVPIARELVENILTATKLQTMIQIYDRMEPGPDGKINNRS